MPLPSTPPPTDPVTDGVVTQTVSADPGATATDAPPVEFEEWRHSVLADGGSVVTGDGCTLALPAGLTPTAAGTRCDPKVTMTWADAAGAQHSAPVTFTTRQRGASDACVLARATGSQVTPLVAAENNGVSGCRATGTGYVGLFLDDVKGGAVRSVEARVPGDSPEVQDVFGRAETALSYTVMYATAPGRWTGTLPPGTISRG